MGTYRNGTEREQKRNLRRDHPGDTKRTEMGHKKGTQREHQGTRKRT